MRSKRRERYSRNLEGLNAHGFYSNSVITPSYTGQATMAAFLVNAVEGEIGVYNKDGKTLVIAAPLDITDEIYIVQKQDGEIKRTQPFPYQGIKKTIRTPFDAPVIQETIVGWNGTDGSLNINIVGGLQEFVASARETTPANQPFPIQEGRAIVRSGTPSSYYIANRIVEDLLNAGDYESNSDAWFVRADVISDLVGSLGPVVGPTALLFTTGSNVVVGDLPITSPVAGQYIVVGIAIYQVVEVQGSTMILDRPYAGPSASIPVASVLIEDPALVDPAVNVGIRFTGFDELVVFEVSVGEDLADADITETVEWKQGSGAAWQVASMEDETSVFDGWTTLNEAWVQDFGKPSFFVDDLSADQYDLTFLTLELKIIPSAGAPQNQTRMQSYIIIGAEDGTVGDGALAAAMIAIFPAT